MSRAIVLENDCLRVVCYPEHGFTIGSILDKRHDVELLWHPAEPNYEPLTMDLGPAGAPSADFFDRQVLAGGWFAMFPNSGPAGSDGERWMHGEAPRIPWQVLSVSEAKVVCAVVTPVSRFRLIRTVSLAGGKLAVHTTALNVSLKAVPVTYGEHPCFRRDLFSGGTVSVEPNTTGMTGSQGDPENSQLAEHQTFLWPTAKTKRGNNVNVGPIPDQPDGRHNHLVLAPAQGSVTLSSPSSPQVKITWDTGTMGYALLWQHYQPSSSPWNGDVLAIEPTSTPARTWEESKAQGTTRTVQPGESIAFGCSLELLTS